MKLYHLMILSIKILSLQMLTNVYAVDITNVIVKTLKSTTNGNIQHQKSDIIGENTTSLETPPFKAKGNLSQVLFPLNDTNSSLLMNKNITGDIYIKRSANIIKKYKVEHRNNINNINSDHINHLDFDPNTDKTGVRFDYNEADDIFASKDHEMGNHLGYHDISGRYESSNPQLANVGSESSLASHVNGESVGSYSTKHGNDGYFTNDDEGSVASYSDGSSNEDSARNFGHSDSSAVSAFYTDSDSHESRNHFGKKSSDNFEVFDHSLGTDARYAKDVRASSDSSANNEFTNNFGQSEKSAEGQKKLDISYANGKYETNGVDIGGNDNYDSLDSSEVLSPILSNLEPIVATSYGGFNGGRGRDQKYNNQYYSDASSYYPSDIDSSFETLPSETNYGFNSVDNGYNLDFFDSSSNTGNNKPVSSQMHTKYDDYRTGNRVVSNSGGNYKGSSNQGNRPVSYNGGGTANQNNQFNSRAPKPNVGNRYNRPSQSTSNTATSSSLHRTKRPLSSKENLLLGSTKDMKPSVDYNAFIQEFTSNNMPAETSETAIQQRAASNTPSSSSQQPKDENLIEVVIDCTSCEDKCPESCKNNPINNTMANTNQYCCANSVLTIPDMCPSCPFIDTSSCPVTGSEYEKFHETYFTIEIGLKDPYVPQFGDPTSKEYQNIRNLCQSFVLRVLHNSPYYQDTIVNNIRDSKEYSIVTMLIRFTKENIGNIKPLYKALMCKCGCNTFSTDLFFKLAPANVSDLWNFCPPKCMMPNIDHTSSFDSNNECNNFCHTTPMISTPITLTKVALPMMPGMMNPFMNFDNSLFGQMCPNMCPSSCFPGCTAECCGRLGGYKRMISHEHINPNMLTI